MSTVGLFSMNQTRISKRKGEIAASRLVQGGLAVTYNPAATSTLVPAQPVHFIGYSGATMDTAMIVDAATSSTSIHGFVINGLRSASYSPQSQLDIAIDGMIMIMEASEAMTAGADVYCVFSSAVQIKSEVSDSDSYVKIGVLLDNATTAGDLVRVLIKISN